MAELDELRHDIFIKSKKRIEVNGVEDVLSFDEKEIVAQIKGFGLSIEGDNLKIEKFSSETGDLVVNGIINGVYYFSKEPQKKKKGISNIFS